MRPPFPDRIQVSGEVILVLLLPRSRLLAFVNDRCARTGISFRSEGRRICRMSQLVNSGQRGVSRVIGHSGVSGHMPDLLVGLLSLRRL